MPELYGRTWELQVHDLKLVGEFPAPALSVTFSIERTLKMQPNDATITLLGLAAETRQRLQGLERVAVSLAVGYGGDNTQIFSGDLRDVQSSRQGSSWSTTITSGDGETAIRTSRTSRAFAAGTKVKDVIEGLADDLKLGAGNASKAVKDAVLAGNGADSFSSGASVTGSAARELDRIMRSVDREWSVQDGVIQVLAPGEPLATQAVLLTPQTGLVGSPDHGAQGQTVCTALLQPGLLPGYPVRLESEHVQGNFRIERASYDGETTGTAWYAHLELK